MSKKETRQLVARKFVHLVQSSHGDLGKEKEKTIRIYAKSTSPCHVQVMSCMFIDIRGVVYSVKGRGKRAGSRTSWDDKSSVTS